MATPTNTSQGTENMGVFKRKLMSREAGEPTLYPKPSIHVTTAQVHVHKANFLVERGTESVTSHIFIRLRDRAHLCDL